MFRFFIPMISIFFVTSCFKKKSDNSPEALMQIPMQCDFQPQDQKLPPSNPRIGIVVTAFNRVEYLRPTLEALKHSNLDENVSVVIVDDASSDPRVLKIIDDYEIPSIKKKVIKIKFPKNKGLLQAMLAGMEVLKDSTDYLMNLDPDTYVKKNWVPGLIKTFEAIHHQYAILTGFNAQNHPIISCTVFDKKQSYCEKKSLSGVNFFFTTAFYKAGYSNWLKEIDQKVGWKLWDWKVMECMRKHQLKVYTSSPSLVQHIGATGTNTKAIGDYDFAYDF